MIILLALAILLQQDDARAIERLARDGWQHARAAAPAGGTAESVAPAARAVAELDKLITSSKWPLQATYARSLVAAAIAAAQDERAEMSLHLRHAREISERLSTSALPAMWPFPIDEAEGELRFEVDEYAEAMAAFQRAAVRTTRAAVLMGLARSALQMNHTDLACYGYRRALLLSPTEAERVEARDFVVRCR
jgi:hypothetical protein